MVCGISSDKHTIIADLDPRVRIVVCLGVSGLTAVCAGIRPAAFSLSLALLLAVQAQLRWCKLWPRLLALNVFMVFLLVVMSLGDHAEPMVRVGPLSAGVEGFKQAAIIAIKGNAVLLLCVALLGSLDPTTFGHALQHLHVPRKLTHLLLFTLRYIDILRHEHHRLSQAMKARGFRATLSYHTYRSYGYLAGMLLVNSYERSERILAAMKCRGFQGAFHVLSRFHIGSADIVFFIAAVAVAATLVFLELGL